MAGFAPIFFVLFVYMFLFAGLTLVYVLEAIAVMRLGKRVGAERPWLAWIPIANAYALGLVADRCREKQGQDSKFRRILLFLEIGLIAGSVLIGIVISVFMFLNVVSSAPDNFSEDNIAGIIASGVVPALLSGLMSMVLGAVSLAYMVLTYVVMWHIFNTFVPDNAVILLILSIVFSVLTPFILLYVSGKKPAVFDEPDDMPGYGGNDDSGDHYLSF